MNPGHNDLLVTNSFHVSAMRILAAMDGVLQVTNSRSPTAAPAVDPIVRGFCGQGGRHSYFALSPQLLRQTCEEILLSRDIDSVHDSCAQLRTNTSFDAATGCVNDGSPALVPLMPPEEIWYRGRELPLDIWRLLSFESDQLSTAILHGFAPTDPGVASLSYNSLAFSRMMQECGRTSVAIDVLERDFGASPHASGNAPVTVTLRELFLEAGTLLTPSKPADITHWYSAVRYLSWLATGGGELRVKTHLGKSSIDARYRGLFSEEMAVGVMAVLLRRRYGARAIVNTAEYHSHYNLVHAGRNADFIADGVEPTSGQPFTLIAESKGSIRQVVSASRRRHAKTQVQETQLGVQGGTHSIGLAFATSLRYENQKKRSLVEVIDPEPNNADEELDPALMYCMAYAKALRFIGFEAASRQVLAGRSAASLPDPHREHHRDGRIDYDVPYSTIQRRRSLCRELFGAEIIRDLGPVGVMVSAQTLSVLRSGISRSSLATLRDSHPSYDASHSGTGFLNSLGIGIAAWEELE